MCGGPLENLTHFILFWPAYDQERVKHPALQRPYQENTDAIIGALPYHKRDIEKTKDILQEFREDRQKER